MSCNDGTFLHLGKCLSTCPDTYYGESTTNTCDKCHSECYTCSGKTNKLCKSCKSESTRFLLDTSCVEKCPDGKYADKNKQ